MRTKKFASEIIWPLALPEIESCTKQEKKLTMTLVHTSFSLCKDLNNEMTDKKFVLILLQLDKKEIQEIFPEEILSKNNYKSQKMTFVATQSSSN